MTKFRKKPVCYAIIFIATFSGSFAFRFIVFFRGEIILEISNQTTNSEKTGKVIKNKNISKFGGRNKLWGHGTNTARRDIFQSYEYY